MTSVLSWQTEGSHPIHNVTLIGGIHHPFEETAAELAGILEEQGVVSFITEDVDEAIGALAGASLFTLNALRWRMLNHEKYLPYMDRWSYELPSAHGRALMEFVDRGGGLLGMHTASICFDAWPEYRHLLGGAWAWERTFHPPLGCAEIRPAPGQADEPGPSIQSLTAGMASFNLCDEIYHCLDVAAGSQIILEGRLPHGPWQPISWAREQGAGRVIYHGLGHDAASLRNECHRTLVARCYRWLRQLNPFG